MPSLPSSPRIQKAKSSEELSFRKVEWNNKRPSSAGTRIQTVSFESAREFQTTANSIPPVVYVATMRKPHIATIPIPVVPIPHVIRPCRNASPPFSFWSRVKPKKHTAAQSKSVFDFSNIKQTSESRTIILPTIKTMYDPMSKINSRLVTKSDALKILRLRGMKTYQLEDIPNQQAIEEVNQIMELDAKKTKKIKKRRNVMDLLRKDGEFLIYAVIEAMQAQQKILEEAKAPVVLEGYEFNMESTKQKSVEPEPVMVDANPKKQKAKRKTPKLKVKPIVEIRRMSRRASELAIQSNVAPVVAYEIVEEEGEDENGRRTSVIVGPPGMTPLSNAQVIQKSFHKLNLKENLEGVI